MIPARKIGIFSGSFNPIHIGHLALANYLCEYEGLNEVWFVVSPQNPFKTSNDLLNEQQRFEMVRLAVSEYPKFRASDVEFSFPRPSYTIRTLDYLKKHHPEHAFVLLIGADNWSGLSCWKQAERLINEYEMIIYPRLGHPVEVDSLPPTVRLSSAPIIDVSSTLIRRGLAEGKDMRFFLHPSTALLIDKEKFYR